jgi:hypothetical protein
MNINKSASVLGNTSPEILNPAKTNLGLFQIKWIEELNTHVLLLDRGEGGFVVASKHNGHSLRALVNRIEKNGSAEYIREQLNYIRECGGTVAAEHFFLEK